MWRRIAVATISLAVVNRMAQPIINSMCCKVTWQFATPGIKIQFNPTVCTTTLEHLQTPMLINVLINYFSSSFFVLSFVTFNLVFKIVNYQILKHLRRLYHFWKIHMIEICCSGYSTPYPFFAHQIVFVPFVNCYVVSYCCSLSAVTSWTVSIPKMFVYSIFIKGSCLLAFDVLNGYTSTLHFYNLPPYLFTFNLYILFVLFVNRAY